MQQLCKMHSTACTNLLPYLRIKDPKGIFDTAIDKQTLSLSGHRGNSDKTWMCCCCTSEQQKLIDNQF